MKNILPAFALPDGLPTGNEGYATGFLRKKREARESGKLFSKLNCYMNWIS